MRYDRLRLMIYFVAITLLMLYLVYVQAWIGVAVMVALLFLGVLILLFPNSDMETEDDSFYDEKDEPQSHHPAKKDYLLYYGDELDIEEDEIITILEKHSSFYTMLDDPAKQKFTKRLSAFIKEKDFKIHDKSGFKEMPVLISATAIQVSFGLEKYDLPHFTSINIYPSEFIEVQRTIRFLEGNVSGNSINISWKYFLEGFEFPQDGQNVGLHEMAHAYYYQNFGPCENKDPDFINAFQVFNDCGNKIYTGIQQPGAAIYSDYAKRNFQEFWAESVELFFEKPMEVRTTYPALYQSISQLLRQDPANRIT